MKIVVAVEVAGPYTLDVTFDDGVRRRINLEPELYGEVFEPLRYLDRFAEVAVDPELGTAVWPNGADVAPEFLYRAGERVSADPPRARTR